MSSGAVSKAGWKTAAKHLITLPSSAKVEIVIPDLARLIETNQIPQNLLDAALSAAGRQSADEKLTREMIIEQREFTDALVKITVVNPQLTDADLADIPYEDKQLIVEIATRQRDLDAEGEHIGGLSSSAKWRSFRGVEPIGSTLADL